MKEFKRNAQEQFQPDESTERIFIHKCHSCGCIAENVLMTDDETPYIICNWCGVVVDMPFTYEEGDTADIPLQELGNQFEENI